MCPEVDIEVGGVMARSLLDTGSQVSTISETFFQHQLLGKNEDITSTANWLKLTAANSLPIPYIGYIELDVQAMGLTVPQCGFLVVRDPVREQRGSEDPELDSNRSKTEGKGTGQQSKHNSLTTEGSLPVLIGMNVIKQCRELVIASFDSSLGEKLDTAWREAFQRVQTCEALVRASTARIAGRDTVHVPAASVATVYAKGLKQLSPDETLMLEPISTPLPNGLVVVPTLVQSSKHVFPVQVVNFSQEDIWLPARSRLGVLSEVQCIEEATEVHFNRISADHEEVSVNSKGAKASDEELQSMLGRLNIGGSSDEQAKLAVLLAQYVDVFAFSYEDLGYTDKVQHEIHSVDDVPVTQPYRRVPPTQYQEVREHITQLLKKGVIKESTSAYTSPIVLVRKADNSLRLCVDYRCLNAKTRRDAFPLPRIDECFDTLHGAKFFSTIDLASGYHQVAVQERDRHKTAFTTPFGLFEYIRLPFGVCNWACNIPKTHAGNHE